jgi:hypothetical protein
MADEEKRQEVAVWSVLLLVSALFLMALVAEPPKQPPHAAQTPLEKRGDEAFSKLLGLETYNETVRQAPQGTEYAGRLIKTRVCYTPKGTTRGESWVESSAGWVKIFDELQ